MSDLRRKLWAFQSRNAPYLFIAPFLILFCIFMIYPLTRSVVLSLYKTAGPRHERFVGLGNYRFVVTDRLFWLAVYNTVRYAIAFLLIQIPGSLILALLLNSKLVRGRNLFRFAFFSPHLVGNVFVAVIFVLMLAPRQGLINRGIGAVFPVAGFGGGVGKVWPHIGTETTWTSNPALTMPAIVMASLWLSMGYGMVYFLAALQGVDRELYEAADVDGAGQWSKFWNVTFPGIRSIFIFMILVGTIGALQLFELPYVLFQGTGPNNSALTIVMYLFQQGFEVGDIGYASAVGWMLVFFILIISLLELRATRGDREDE